VCAVGSGWFLFGDGVDARVGLAARRCSSNRTWHLVSDAVAQWRGSTGIWFQTLATGHQQGFGRVRRAVLVSRVERDVFARLQARGGDSSE